jgi:hypothetical protein
LEPKKGIFTCLGKKKGPRGNFLRPAAPRFFPDVISWITSADGEGHFPRQQTKNICQEAQMKKLKPPKGRVQRFLAKRAKKKKKGWDYSDAPDERQQGKVGHEMASILWSMELGLTSNQPTLRDVEAFGPRLPPLQVGASSARPVPFQNACSCRSALRHRDGGRQKPGHFGP